MKCCVKCKQLKNISDFYREKDNICKDCIRKTSKEYYLKNKANRQAYQKKYYNEHLEYRKQYDKKYGDEHREERNKKQREYYLKNKDIIREKDKKRNKNIGRTFSRNLYDGLKSNKAGRHWEDLVPYNLQQLCQHLESQFTSSMTWSNYGTYWEIDHIIPQNTFNISSPEDNDFKVCWSLANLRPLTIKENRSRPKDGSDISEDVKQKILSQGEKFYEEEI